MCIRQVLQINGKSVGGLVMAHVNQLANTPIKGKVTFRVQFDPAGYAPWDNGAELAAAKAAAGSTGAANSPSATRSVALELSDRWWFGTNSKDAVAEAIRSHPAGTFAVRSSPRNPKGAVALAINDNGKVAEFTISINAEGGAKFGKSKFPTLDDVISFFYNTPQKSKNGGNEFVATAPLLGGIEFNFYEFINGGLATPLMGQSRGSQQVMTASKADLKSAKKQAKSAQKERRRSLRLDKKAEKKADKDAKKAGKEREKEAEAWVCPTWPVQRVALAKRDNMMFGVTFIGPSGDKGDSHTGVYIVEVAPNTVAGNDGQLKPGMKLLAMNGQPMVLATTNDALRVLKDAVTAIMTVQMDPEGFGQYDNNKMYNSIRDEALGVPESDNSSSGITLEVGAAGGGDSFGGFD